MNKTWLTGITIAGIAGSGGLAYAGVNVISSASAESAPAAESTAPAAIRSITYQIGVAGLVTIQSDGTTLTALDPHPGTGWTFVGATDAAAHVDVQFTDGQQLVTFSADQVGAEIIVSVTNVEAPGATTTTVAPEPIVVTIVTDAPVDTEAPAPTTTPATPAPTPPPATTIHVATPTPAPATTTKPSPAHHEDDDEGDHGDHEDENEDD